MNVERIDRLERLNGMALTWLTVQAVVLSATVVVLGYTGYATGLIEYIRYALYFLVATWIVTIVNEYLIAKAKATDAYKGA